MNSNALFDLGKSLIVEGLSVRLDPNVKHKGLSINLNPRVNYELDGDEESKKEEVKDPMN